MQIDLDNVNGIQERCMYERNRIAIPQEFIKKLEIKLRDKLRLYLLKDGIYIEIIKK